MKPYILYGTYIALINFCATLLLYLTGFHSAPEKLGVAGGIGLVVWLGSTIAFMVAGIRTRRNLTPPTDDFKFGMALGIAVVVALVATVLSTAFQFIYQSFINTDYKELMIQSQISAMQAKGYPAEVIQDAENGMRNMSPLRQAIFSLILATVFNVVIALIIAPIMRRKAVADTPPLPGA